MTSTNVKVTKLFAKVMTVGLLAGAFVMGTPQKAQAQGFAVGVQIGYPHYDYSRRDYYEHERREAFARQQAYERQLAYERQQAFLRHEAWEHRGRGWDRDRDDRFRGGDRDDYRGR
ncbi:hypothetical protein BH10ACI4_BH10ACI4_15690 [soil metagenome]